MAGLDPAIHLLNDKVDARVERRARRMALS
jgi:hypothetical protein